jgi:hypothetical protein
MVELSFEELDRTINDIAAGQKLVTAENSKGQEILLLFRHPSLKDRARAEIVYKRALAAAKKDGFLSIEEMEKIITQRKLFTEADQAAVEKLQSRLEGQRAVLLKTTRVPARRDRLKDNIADLEEQIAVIQAKRENALEFTSERKAAEAKLLYYTQRGVLDPDTEQRFWDTESLFRDEKDAFFVKAVFVQYIVYIHGMDVSLLRYIARSNLWRVRFSTAMKTGGDLFGCPISEYSPDQLMLSYWSNFYQSVYEMLSDDRPPENVITDDAALDAYMKDWHAERSRDDAASRAKKGNKHGKPSAWDYKEVLVTKTNDHYEDIDYSGTLAEKSQHKGATSIDAAPIGRSKEKGRF